MKFSEGVGCLTGNQSFDFGVADPDHNPDP